MAIAVNVAGLCTVKVGTGSAGALESLGYTRDGAHPSHNGYFLDVPGDENGGEAGPPVDVQYMGETAMLRIELTKYDKSIFEKVRVRVNGATSGTPSSAGTLMFSNAIRVLLSTPNDPQNFLLGFVRNAYERNLGTRYSTAVLEFECHKNASGVLYNTVTA